MTNVLQLHTLSIIFILLVFLYTIHLVRTNKLSAHLAISWIVTELAFLVLSLSDSWLSHIRSTLGEQNSLLAPSLFGLAWLAFLTLDSLTRISSLTFKLKEVNQEVAILRERLDRVEKHNEHSK